MALTYEDGAYQIDGEDATEEEVIAYRDQQVRDWEAELAQIAVEELGIEGAREAIEFPSSRVSAFATRFLVRVGEIVTDAFVWASGGVDRVTEAGWSIVAAMVSRQTEYGRGFVAALRTGDVSDAQAVARARLYAGAAVEAFERGKSSQRGFDDADGEACYPASGCTRCLTQCRCWLSYDERNGELLITWHTTDEEACPDCKDFAKRWNPRRAPLGDAA